MVIRTGSRVTNILFLIWFISESYFGLFSLPIDSNTVKYGLWALSACLFIVYFNQRHFVYNEMNTFIDKYLIYILIAQVILIAYSMIVYKESIVDMYICAGGYLTLMLTLPIMLSFHYDGFHYFMKRLIYFELIYIILVLIVSAIYNNIGVEILSFSIDLLRDGRARIGLGVFRGLFFIYVFYSLIYEKKKIRNLVVLSIGIVALFYSEMTRMNEFATIGTLIIMWLFYRQKNGNSMWRWIVFVGCIVLLANIGVFDSILNSFSSDYSINSNASSTVARLNAIEYFQQYTAANPLLGMGWVRPYTAELTKIFSGPYGTAFFDDLGIMGQFYHTGLMGLSIYIIMLIRMFYVITKTDKDIKERIILIGIFSYLIFTLPSLNCFDYQRIMSVPVYLAIFEYVYQGNEVYEGCDYTLEDYFDEYNT